MGAGQVEEVLLVFVLRGGGGRMMEKKTAMPVVQAKLKFQVKLILLHPSGLTARRVPVAAFHLPGLLGRRVGL